MFSLSFLEVNNLTKRFGGLTANKDVSFNLDQGQIVSLIGPNGAGKTTLFNCLTGFLKAEEGKVFFMGKNVTGMTPQQMLSNGIARTFQITKTFRNMTVFDNVMVGSFFRYPKVGDAFEATLKVLEFSGLKGKEKMLGSSLTVADRKRVEVARALATEPTLIMLDEAMAGLNRTEVADATCFVRKIREKGVTVLLVEHIMEVVMPLSDWILVMDQGALIAQGEPKDIVQDDRVIKAYLGENWDA